MNSWTPALLDDLGHGAAEGPSGLGAARGAEVDSSWDHSGAPWPLAATAGIEKIEIAVEKLERAK